ncbi:MAG: hypothetical protein ABIO70_32260 [Pseudomonadota bacterium]
MLRPTDVPHAPLRLHLNEVPESVLSGEEVASLLATVEISRYRDEPSLRLRREIAETYGLGEDHVLLDAGADGVLRLVFSFLARSERRVWLPVLDTPASTSSVRAQAALAPPTR